MSLLSPYTSQNLLFPLSPVYSKLSVVTSNELSYCESKLLFHSVDSSPLVNNFLFVYRRVKLTLYHLWGKRSALFCDISQRRVVIPSRIMRWAEHVARMGKGFGWGNLRETDHLEDTSVDGRIIWRWIFREWDGGQWLDLSGSGYGQVAGCCKCGNEPSGPVKCGTFLD